MAEADNRRPLDFAEELGFVADETGRKKPERVYQRVPPDWPGPSATRLLALLGVHACNVDDLYNFGPSPQTPRVPNRVGGLILLFQVAFNRF